MKRPTHDDPGKNEFIRCAVDHCVKTEALLWFAPCYFFGRPDCSHCSSLGPRSEMLTFLTEKLNSVLPFPEASLHLPAHYRTFLDIMENPGSRRYANIEALNSCDEHIYHFDSEADMRRHFDICHNGQPTHSHAKDYFKCSRVKNKLHCTFSCDSMSAMEVHVANEHSSKRCRNDSGSTNLVKDARKKAKHDFYSISTEGTNYLLEGKILELGSRVDAWFDDEKKFFCGVVEGFTRGGRAKLHFPSDDTRNSFSTRLRLCRCTEM